VATGVEVATSSHREETIKKLVQSEGLEVSATGMILEGTTTTAGEPSSQSNLQMIYRLWILSLVEEQRFSI